MKIIIVGISLLVLLFFFFILSKSLRERQQVNDRTQQGSSYKLSAQEIMISQKLNDILRKGNTTLPLATKSKENDDLNVNFSIALHQVFKIMRDKPSRARRYAESWHIEKDIIEEYLPKTFTRYKSLGQDLDYFEKICDWKDTESGSVYTLK